MDQPSIQTLKASWHCCKQEKLGTPVSSRVSRRQFVDLEVPGYGSLIKQCKACLSSICKQCAYTKCKLCISNNSTSDDQNGRRRFSRRPTEWRTTLTRKRKSASRAICRTLGKLEKGVYTIFCAGIGRALGVVVGICSFWVTSSRLKHNADSVSWYSELNIKAHAFEWDHIFEAVRS